MNFFDKRSKKRLLLFPSVKLLTKYFHQFEIYIFNCTFHKPPFVQMQTSHFISTYGKNLTEKSLPLLIRRSTKNINEEKAENKFTLKF